MWLLRVQLVHTQIKRQTVSSIFVYPAQLILSETMLPKPSVPNAWVQPFLKLAHQHVAVLDSTVVTLLQSASVYVLAGSLPLMALQLIRTASRTASK